MPETLNTDIYDEIIAVKDEDAFKTGRTLARKEGVLVGISSGAAIFAAAELAKRPERNKRIFAQKPSLPANCPKQCCQTTMPSDSAMQCCQTAAVFLSHQNNRGTAAEQTDVE